MKNKILSFVLSISMISSLGSGFAVTTVEAAAKTPQYQPNARQMEQLGRGLIAVYRTKDDRSVMQQDQGVFLSWRLLGTESLENQAFDIYRGTSATGMFSKIYTTGAHDATNYIDKTASSANYYYKVVRKGESAAGEKAVKAAAVNVTPKGSEVGSGASLPGSYTYVDIPIDRPADVARMGDGKTSHYYNTSDKEGGANDASVGDIDGDGEYELILKWDPTDSKDSAGADFTGNVYIDAYEIDPNATAVDGKYRKWRIDMGKNVTAGAHYTQFIVYDFDGDGRSEVAMKTAPGTVDGTGKYVTEVGDTDAIRNIDNTKSYIGTSGRLKGKNPFTQFLTVFDGETGEALATTEYIPYEMHSKSYWGDPSAKYNRSERYLAAVAYIDGVHPSIVMCRGYYNHAVVRTYIWDGTELTLQWEHDGASKSATSIYGNGNHNLSVADIDNDGRDEIVYGSVALDDNGVAMGNTYLGHGDAMHVNDFNNDGVQEVFSVKEDKEGYAKNAANFRVAATGQVLWGKGAAGDTGRGVMANIDDEYAKTHPNALALGWTSSHTNVFDLSGNEINAKPSKAGSGSFDNNLIYWDGDLSRELLDTNIIQKYDAANGWSKRFYGPSNGYTLDGGATNNYTKRNASLSADIWGDWREEVMLPINKGSQTEQAYIRIYTSTMPTDYRLTTLMHDSQYRCAIAWQNVGYNQPPHTSYYIGSAALATDASGNTLNYLAPAVPYTNVTYEQPEKVDVTGITLGQAELSVEKGRSATISANIEPSNASKKGVTWTTSDSSVATVQRGVVTGVNPGTATITATTNDGGFTADCKVNVWSTPVTGITVSSETLNVGSFLSKKLTAAVVPSDASDQNYTWSSSNSSVATVDAGGNVYGASVGEADIIATSAEGGFKAACHVKVVPMQTVDATGTDVYKTDNTDSATTLSGASAAGATLTQNGAAVGGNMYKTFTKVTENKAELTFRFTTGGIKIDGSNWNWTGHEYSVNVELLGEDDQNILKLTQPYASSAGTLMSKNGNNAEEAFATSWTSVVDGLGNIQGSAKRWIVNVVFDYENDTATATLTGTSSTWDTIDGQYTKEFDLNGLSLEKLRVYTTNDAGGTIQCKPVIAATSYIKQTEIDGTLNTLYERGTTSDTAWSQEDVNSWTHTGTLNYSADGAEHGRILYNPTKPGEAYNAKKTFTLDANDEMVTYDVDWHFGNAMNRESVYDYIQFGDKLRLAWKNGYKVYVSTDGGETFDADAIFTGSNSEFTKHIQVIFDPAMTSIKSLRFDGNEIMKYKDYWFGSKTAVDSVSFGLVRGGSTENWEFPNGLDSIRVVEFTGKDAPVRVTPTPRPTATPLPSPSPSPTPTAMPTPTPQAVVDNVSGFVEKERITVSEADGTTTFTAGSNANNTRAYAHCDYSSYVTGEDKYIIEFDSNFSSDSRARVALVDPSKRPGTSNKNVYDTVGVAFVQGVMDSSSYAAMNDKTKGNAPGARDAWVHTTVEVDTVNKTITYAVTAQDGTKLLSAANVSYLDAEMSTPTTVEYLDTVNNKVGFIKDIKVTTYKSAEPEPTATPAPPTDTPAPPTDTPAPPTDTPASPTAPPTETPVDVEVKAFDLAENTASAEVKNNEEAPVTVMLLVAVYDEDGKLVSVELEEKEIAAGESDRFEVINDAEGQLKAFLWNVTANNKPLAEVKSPLAVQFEQEVDEADLPDSVSVAEAVEEDAGETVFME
ncbi:MAG: Ig-like domain-containing protein [Clostridia bacterium]|nr:Ig-like domain-containing protein [Clostridia bacterium]